MTASFQGTVALPRVVRAISEVRARVADARRGGGRIVLVPTLGALHDGHRELVRFARSLGDLVIVSVFVNPLQFGEVADLDRYPRTLDADVAALAGSADLVFAPSAASMYPPGGGGTRVLAGPVGETLEGASRPGHFDGVLTVVAKLLNIVGPDTIVFGHKDAQQVYLVERMVQDLDFPVVVRTVETVRGQDGLAESSRNRFLSVSERRSARALPDALAAAAQSRGPARRALEAARAVLDAEPAVRVDYLVAVDPATFTPVDDDAVGQLLIVVAGRVGSTRLIDNIVVTL